MRSLPVTQLRSHPHWTPEVGLTLSFVSCGETRWDESSGFILDIRQWQSDVTDQLPVHGETFKLAFKSEKQDSEKVLDHFPLKPRHKSQNASLLFLELFDFRVLISGEARITWIRIRCRQSLSVHTGNSCWQISSIQVILSNKNQNQNSFIVPQTGKRVSTAAAQKY